MVKHTHTDVPSGETIQEAIESLSTESLFNVFQRAFEANLKLRQIPVDQTLVIERMKSSFSREALLELARTLPAVIEEMRQLHMVRKDEIPTQTSSSLMKAYHPTFAITSVQPDSNGEYGL